MSGSHTHTLKFKSKEIRTTIISHELALEGGLKLLLSKLSRKRIVGLDIEKSFSSPGHGVVSDKVALLKLCAENDCLLVHLILFTQIPTFLAKFLNLLDVKFVGISIKQNLADLERDYGIKCRNAVELGPLAAYVRMKPILRSYSLTELLNFFCPFEKYYYYGKSTNVVFSDWGTSTLTMDQIRDASIEVNAIIMIMDRLRND
uniref:3'-5' exonuclease domain-containing protein n=1 Tax=Fagus sylvatica TaxID=28930 RepID=A0A2N9FUF2_FAGSY